MDEMQRREAYEALQRTHKQDWLKQVGLKPLETKPLPQLIAEGAAEAPSEEPSVQDEKSYVIPPPEEMAIEERDDSSKYVPNEVEQSIRDNVPLATIEDTPQKTPYSPPETKETPSASAVVADRSPDVKQESTTPAKQEAAAQAPVENKAPAPTPEQEKAAAEYQSRQEATRSDRMAFKRQVKDERADLREKAIKEFQAAREEEKKSYFSSNGYGSTPPSMATDTNPLDVGLVAAANGNSNTMFAAAAVDAMAASAALMLHLSERMRAIELVIRDGAS